MFNRCVAWLCIAIGCIASTDLFAQSIAEPGEFVIVTTDAGYVRDNNDQTVAVLRNWTLAKVTEVLVSDYVVQTYKTEFNNGGFNRTPVNGRINKNLVQLTEFTEQTGDDWEFALQIAALLNEANDKLFSGDTASAVEISKLTLQLVEDNVGTDNEFYPWILTTHANYLESNGDQQQANATLQKSSQLLKNAAFGQARLADVLNVKGLIFQLRGEHEESIPLFKRAHEILIANHGESHVDCVAILSNLAVAYDELEQFEESLAAMKRANEIYFEILPKDAIEISSVAYSLGKAYARLAKNADADIYLRRAYSGFSDYYGSESDIAIEIRDELAALGNVGAADSLAGLPSSTPNSGGTPGDMLQNLEGGMSGAVSNQYMLVVTQATNLKSGNEVLARVTEGTKLWSLAQSGDWHKVRVPNGPGFGYVWNGAVEPLAQQLGVARFLARIAQFKSEADEQAAIQSAKEAMQLIFRAQELSQSGDESQAALVFEKALKFADDALGGENFLSASLRNMLIESYMSREEFLKAKSTLERSLPILKNSLGENHEFVADNLMRLSAILSKLGDVDSAAKNMRMAVSICEYSFGPLDERTIRARLELGNRLSDLGQFDAARKLLLQVSRHTQFDVERKQAFVILGQLEYRAGDFEQAEQCLQQARQLAPGAAPALDAIMEMVTWLVKSAQMQPDLVLAAATKADAIFETMENKDRLLVSQNIGLKALALLLSGQSENALVHVKKSVQGVAAVMGAHHPTTADVRLVMARILAVINGLENAEREFDHARRDIHNHVVRALIELKPQQQIAYLKSNDANNLQAALSFGVRFPQYAENAATWLFNGKNLSHEIAARRSRIQRLAKTDAIRKKISSWSDVRRQLAILPSSIQDDATTTLRDAEKKRLQRIERETFNSLPLDVQQDIQSQQIDWVTCQEVREKLSADETLIEMARIKLTKFQLHAGTEDNEHYVAWVIPPAGVGTVEVIDLGVAKEIDELVAAAREATISPFRLRKDRTRLIDDAEVGEAVAEKQTLVAYRKLAEQIWLPIAEKIKMRPNVCISPDGNLWLVPWASLPLPDGRFLLEEHGIRLIVSGRYIANNVAAASNGNQPVIFANPAYDANPADITAALRSSSIPFAKTTKTDLPDLPKLALPEFEPLPNTEREAAEIRGFIRQYSGAAPELLVDEKASEVVFNRLRQPDALFIGTHGFFQPDIGTTDDAIDGTRAISLAAAAPSQANPLLRCGLLLAGCNKSTKFGADDGILTAAEIVRADLRGTRLIMLSACETGVGKVQSGQGVAGLRQAFQLAGAQSVYSTLWSIDDTETAKLIPIVFKNLASGMDKVEALRQAQITRIEKRRQREGAAHPFYWAAFTITGAR